MGKEYIRNTNVLTTLPNLSDLIYQSDFNNGINLTKTVIGFDHIFNLEAYRSLFPGYCLHMVPRLEGAAAGDTFKISKSVFLNPSKLVTFEFYLFYPQETGIKYLTFGFNWYNVTNTLWAHLRQEYATGKWAYESAEGVFTDFDIPLAHLSFNLWHHVRAVFNFNSQKFIELICDEQIFDISAYPILQLNPAATLGSDFFITLEAADENMPQILIQKILISSIR